MNNKRATKRALLTSVMALVMCVVMLAGTTFAWFTDTASTGVNKIQAGNLDVDIIGEDGKSLDGKSLSFVKAGLTTDAGTEIDPNATTEILWEPGCRYLTQGFKIANKGNLALKWKAVVNKGTTAANEGNFDLLDVIDFYLVTSKDVNDMGTELNEFSNKLAAKTNSGVYYIKGVMKTTAGNDYQGLTLDGISITVYATQLTAEFDSFDNQYDKDAKYTEVIAAGKTFTGKATLSTGITATNPNAVAVEATGDAADVTILDGTFDGGSGGDNACVWAKDGAKVTIKDGTFTVGGDANGVGNSVIYSTGGDITIEGGFFYTNYSYNGKYYVLNQNNGTPGTITVKGGTFVNYDPSTGDDNLGGNFVAPGYSVITETKANGDTWYTVVKGTGATAGTQTELNDAITGNETSTVKLTTAGTYTLPEMTGKDVTIIGTKDTVVDVSTGAAHHGATIALEGVTVKGQTSGNFEGLMHTKKVTYKDCTITGKQTLYANDVEFINCTFDSGADYAIWTYGAKNVTFTDCKFNSTNNQKSVLCYSVLKDQTFTRTFNNCTFTSTGTGDKSAIMINPTESGGGTNTYIVNINNCTATGYSESGISGQTIVGLRNAGVGVIDTITVNIDGATVYTH